MSSGVLWEMTFWLGTDASKLYRPSLRSHELHAPGSKPQTPLRLLAFQLIQLAFKDARGTNRTEAASAIRWLRLRSDYSRVVRAMHCTADAEIKTAFVFQFDWAAHLLDCDPDVVRREGLPIRSDGTAKLHGWCDHGGLRNWRQWREARRQAQALLDARAARRNHQVSERPQAMESSI